MDIELNKSYAVAFSGGLDSTLVSLLMGLRYPQGSAHLLTMLTRGHIFPCLPKIHVKQLKRVLGSQRVFHRYCRIAPEFREVVSKHLFENYRNYGNSKFTVCLGCLLCMDVHMISYCLEHSIPMVCFGFTPHGSEYAVVELPETCRERRKIYGSFGLMFRAPLMEWHMDKKEERDILRQFNIWPGWNFRKVAMGVQPPCLFGIAMHHMDIFFDIHPQPDRNMMTAFIRDRYDLIRQMVIKRLESKGINVEERIARMREMNANEWERYGTDAPMLDKEEERRLYAEIAHVPSVAEDSWPNSVPLFNHPELSRDGRPLRVVDVDLRSR